VVLAVSSSAPRKCGEAEIAGICPRNCYRTIISPTRTFHSYDDFEEIELHSTILIDKKGRVYWARHGGEPFSDMAFLTKQLERMNEEVRR
jgi:hypothetical protein